MKNESSKEQAEKADCIGASVSRICEPFPQDGKVRAKQAAKFLGIGLSTFWLYSKQLRINEPMRYGARVSVWDAKYIRSLAENGIPPAGTEAAK